MQAVAVLVVTRRCGGLVSDSPHDVQGHVRAQREYDDAPGPGPPKPHER